MRHAAVLVSLTTLLAGCSPSVADVASPPPPSAIDTSVRVVDTELLVAETVTAYIDLTNDIVDGADPSLIERVTTAEWAIEEQDGFRALEALGGGPANAGISRFEVISVRGRHTLVDATVAACISGSVEPMRVSIRMVPRDSALVIAEIVPWKDSTWCAPLSLR
jgi:hypothetical protein